MDLYRAFLDAPSAVAEGEYPAISLGSRRRDFLAKSADGSPVFLLHDASEVTYSPAITLKAISVQFQATCRVAVSGQAFEDQFAIVSCDSSVPDLFEVFVCCIAAATERLPSGAGTRDLEASVNELFELFSALARPGSREIFGLWAELFVICRANNIESALAAWRTDQFQRFDFSCGGGCLEVKATVKEQRAHEFSLEQLRTPIEGKGLVASLLLQPQSGGAGIMDLARRIEEAVLANPLLRKKLWENVAASLGSDFSDRLDRKFDVSYAERNIIFYAMADIPSPQITEDARITDIRFRSDLSTVQSSLAAPRSDGLQLLLS